LAQDALIITAQLECKTTIFGNRGRDYIKVQQETKENQIEWHEGRSNLIAQTVQQQKYFKTKHYGNQREISQNVS
jgi:hypothetical protein